MYRDGRWTKTMAQTGAHTHACTHTHKQRHKPACYFKMQVL